MQGIHKTLQALLGWLRHRWLWLIPGMAVLLAGLWLWPEKQLPASLATVQSGQIAQYLLEDGKTRLNQTYTLTLPVTGRIQRLQLMEGDWLEQGQTVTKLDNYARQQELSALEARLQEVQAQRRGVDVQLPKAEDAASARARIREMEYLLQQSRQQRESQEIALESLARERQRQQNLQAEGVISQASYEQTVSQYQQLQKQLQQALSQEQITHQNLEQARLALQKLQHSQHDVVYQREIFSAQHNQLFAQLQIKRDELQQARLNAPIAGPVLEVHQRDAGVLAAGTPLLTLGDLNSLGIETDVLSEEVHMLAVGQPVEITGKALADRVLRGQIARIFPSAFTKISALGVEQQRVKILIDVDQQALKLRPGTSLDLKLITAEKAQTLIIPERALFRSGNQWQVLRLDAEQRLQLQDVVVGLKNDEAAEILQGLQAGDQVLTEMDNQLKPGTKVRPRNSD